MAAPCRGLLVFSDLDGTLLDKQTYSWAPAAGAIAALKERGIPLILSSSKTLSEIAAVRRELGNDSPFVFENGAGAALPEGQFEEASCVAERGGLRVKLFGADHGRILNALHRRRKAGDRWEGFSDWTPDEIVAATGLDREAALLAKDRLATEPLLWRDAEEKLPAFQAALAGDGIRLLKGGRFWCAMGGFDKADAARWLTSLYRQTQPDLKTVALGDSPNDAGMLQAADVAVVINSTNAAEIELPDHPHVIRTKGFGPAGWQEAMTTILREQVTE